MSDYTINTIDGFTYPDNLKKVQGYSIGDDIDKISVNDNNYIFETKQEYEPLTFQINDVLSSYSFTLPDTIIAELCYRISDDGKTWGKWINIDAGETVTPIAEWMQFKARDGYVGTGIYSSIYTNSGWFANDESGLGDIKCYGNVLSLINNNVLSDYAFSAMFYECTRLTSMQELPATTPARYCYDDMFYGCTGLTSAPELPATTLADGCYYNMFNGCTGLTSAPELPATTLVKDCYYYMFNGCTGLTSAPELPATTLAKRCYYAMFQGCTGLTSAPELPATTLAEQCYYNMFNGCTGLTSAPELPATTLAEYCYNNMFYGCTGLASAPELPATTLADRCYYNMFYGCISLNYIKSHATDISANSALKNWVYNVKSKGDFYCPDGMENIYSSGDSGIPTGWIVHTF